MAPEVTQNWDQGHVLCLTISLNLHHCYHFVCISFILYFPCWVLATNLKLVSSATLQEKGQSSTAAWLVIWLLASAHATPFCWLNISMYLKYRSEDNAGMRCTRLFDFKRSKKWVSEIDGWTKETSSVSVDGSHSFWSYEMLVGFPNSPLLASE